MEKGREEAMLFELVFKKASMFKQGCFGLLELEPRKAGRLNGEDLKSLSKGPWK